MCWDQDKLGDPDIYMYKLSVVKCQLFLLEEKDQSKIVDEGKNDILRFLKIY